MFSVRMENVKSLRTWEECETYFTTKKQPRKTANWDHNERPLRESVSKSENLKLVWREDDSYGLQLYDSILVRYYPPMHSTRVVDLYLPSRWSTQSTWAFLDNAGWRHNRQYSALRRKYYVHLALYPSHEPDGWSAHLEFRTGRGVDKLIIENSWHLQAYEMQTGDDGAKFRAKCMSRLDDVTQLLWMMQEAYTPTFDRQKFVPPYSKRNIEYSPVRQLGFYTLDQLQEIVDGERQVLDEEEFEGLKNWFCRLHDAHFSQHNTKTILTQDAIAARITRLLQEREQHTFKRFKRPVKMWSTSKHPSGTHQYFSTRAEAAQAYAEYRQSLEVVA